MDKVVILIPMLFLQIVIIGFLLFLVPTVALWVQGVLSGAKVTMAHLIGMRLRRSPARDIMKAHIMMIQAGLEPPQSPSLRELESHALAGGDILKVTMEVISAMRAGKSIPFAEVAAQDLARIESGIVTNDANGLHAKSADARTDMPPVAIAIAESIIPPAGKIEIDGKEYDAISEDIEIRRGEEVEIVSRLPGLVIVRRR